MTGSKKLFVSYSRRDSRDLALRLQSDLQKAGHKVWLDTSESKGGTSWSAAIENALKNCQVTLTLLSDASLRSEICRAEQLRSLREGKRVIPILVQPDTRRPSYLEHLHYHDFSDPAGYGARLAGLLDDIVSGKSAALPARYQHTVVRNAPARPPHFLPRPNVLDALRRMMIHDRSDQRVVITALQGMSGIGKSVMAATLCHDPLIQDVYPDGVIWVTIGRESGSLATRLRRLLEALGAAVQSNADEKKMTSQLRALLPNKAALIVLDEVWDAEHLKPFMVENTPGLRLLFTTCDAALATAVGAAIYRLDVLSGAEALQLLAQWADTSPDALPEAAHQVAGECGNLPLALALCGGQVRDGMLWEDLLAALRAANLEFLDHPQGSAMKSIKVSLDALERENGIYARHYCALGVFPGDEAVPESAVLTLWLYTNGTNERKARQLITTLADRALIRTSGEAPDRLVELHDLQSRYLRSISGDPRGAHQGLLEAYCKKCPHGWHTGPDDGYFWDHLAYHLREAGLFDDLRALFDHQDWMRARFEHDGYAYAGYLQDLMIAWRDVGYPQTLAQIETCQEPIALADCVRYALIRTSINSLAVHYVPELVARAVETGMWTADRALSTARRVAEAESRVTMYTRLLGINRLDSTQRLEAETQGLEAALAIPDELHRACALGALAPQLEGDLRHQGLAAALAIRNEWSRARALGMLAGQLEGEQKADVLRQGLAAALAISNEWYRAGALGTLAGQLEGEQKADALRQGLAATLTISSEWARARALRVLAPQLEGDLLRQGLEAALTIQSEGDQANALGALAGQLEGDLLRQGLEAALTISNELHRASALGALAGQLEGDLLRQGLAAALAIRSEQAQVSALGALADRLEGEQKADVLRRGLEAVLAIGDEGVRADALGVLAPHLEGDLLRQGLEAALAIADEPHRASALEALAPHLEGDLLRQGLEAAPAIAEELHRVSVLGALAPHLGGDLLRQGLEAALAIRSDGYRAYALGALAPHLEGDLLRQGLAAALTIADEEEQASALEAFLPIHPDAVASITSIRQVIAEILFSLRNGKRRTVLQFCAEEKLFTPPVLSQETLAKIAHHIGEICNEWTWL